MMQGDFLKPGMQRRNVLARRGSGIGVEAQYCVLRESMMLRNAQIRVLRLRICSLAAMAAARVEGRLSLLDNRANWA